MYKQDACVLKKCEIAGLVRMRFENKVIFHGNAVPTTHFAHNFHYWVCMLQSNIYGSLFTAHKNFNDYLHHILSDKTEMKTQGYFMHTFRNPNEGCKCICWARYWDKTVAVLWYIKDYRVMESLKFLTQTMGNRQMIPQGGDAQTHPCGRASKLWHKHITWKCQWPFGAANKNVQKIMSGS